MSALLNPEREFDSLECGECGIVFWVPAHWKKEKVEQRAGFSCPNGHGRKFVGETEAERLKRQLEATQRERDWARSQAATNERARKQAEGKLRGLKKRVAAGVCPCCQRTVSQLARHMKSKHPDYSTEVAR